MELHNVHSNKTQNVYSIVLNGVWVYIDDFSVYICGRFKCQYLAHFTNSTCYVFFSSFVTVSKYTSTRNCLNLLLIELKFDGQLLYCYAIHY